MNGSPVAGPARRFGDLDLAGEAAAEAFVAAVERWRLNRAERLRPTRRRDQLLR